MFLNRNKRYYDATLINLFLLKFLATSSSFIFPFSALFYLKYYADASNSFLREGAVMLSFLSFVLGNIIGGYVGDHFKDKYLIFSTSLLSFLSILAAFLFHNITTAISISFVVASIIFYGAMIPILSCYASMLATAKNRAYIFARMYIFHNIGYIVIFLLGGYLTGISIESLIYLSMGTTVLLSMHAFVFERKLRTIKQESHSATASVPSEEKSTNNLYVYSSFIFFLFLCFFDSQREYHLPIWIDSFYKNSGFIFGVVGVVNSISVLVLTNFIVSITSKFDEVNNLFISSVFYGLGFGLYSFFNSYIAIITLTVVWSIGEILASTYINIIISKYSDINKQSKLFSLTSIVFGVSKMIAVGYSSWMVSNYSIDTGWQVILISGVVIPLVGVFLYKQARN